MCTHNEPSTHTVSIGQVQRILQGVVARGLDIDPILQRVGIQPALLHAPKARVTQAQYARLIQHLRRLTRDELWWLCDTPLPIGSFTHICRHVIHQPTLAAAIQKGTQIFRLLQPTLQPRLLVNNKIAKINLPYPRQCTASIDYAIRTFCFFSYGLMSWLIAHPIPLLRLTYPKTYQKIDTEAPTLFQAEVRYQDASATMEFEKKWLERPLTQTEHSLEEFISQLPANMLIRYRNQSSTSERVQRFLKRHQSKSANLGLRQVSQGLGLSPSTLRRHLHQEGSNFQNIKDAVRRDLAISQLQNPDRSLSDIAHDLGFSEASTFHRAFKHWTGVTPGFYRQKFTQPK